MTRVRYVGRFLPMIQSGGDCVIVLADSSSCEYIGVRIESDVRGTDRYTIARMVAAALNAYNQPQEQKQEVPK